MPRGFRAATMRSLQDEAPAWQHAAKSYVDTISLYCAEDSALFAAEVTVGNGIVDGMNRPVALAQARLHEAEGQATWIP